MQREEVCADSKRQILERAKARGANGLRSSELGAHCERGNGEEFAAELAMRLYAEAAAEPSRLD
jgi:hypothetical protein